MTPYGKAEERSTTELRVDWSSFVKQKLNQEAASNLLTPSDMPAGILEYMSWTGEDHVYGISKLWLNRTHADQEEGAAKRMVAYRYILASLAVNRWVVKLRIFRVL
jgi:hypothetical protein